MDTRTGRCIVLCTLIAGVWSFAVPAAAAESRTLADRSGPHTGLAGQVLSDEEMGSMRARYAPPGNTVIVQTGNGNNTSTTYYQRDPATPGSATVTTTGSTASAATGVGGTSASVNRTFSVARSFGARY